MRLETLSYSQPAGWSAGSFPELDSERTLVVLFGAARYRDDPAPIRALRAAYPRAQWIGCSTSGEIHGAALHDDTLTVAIARFEDSDLRAAQVAVGQSTNSLDAGREIAERLSSDDLRAVLVLSDGLHVNGSELVKGLNSGLSDSVVITGGLAGDGDRFQQTWVLGDDGPEAGLISAIGLYGDHVRVGHGSKGGWDIFGPERRITRSRENILFELDGQPALQLYKRYLGARASGLPATALYFPLAVRADTRDTKPLVRTILSVDEAQQSLTFAGNMPQGHLAQLMHANLERLIEGASSAALSTRRTGGDPTAEVLSIAISCVGRRLVLGERTEEEIESALGVLSQGAKQIGFYSYGEISPYASGHCDLHNQTMTLTTISEVGQA